MPTIFVPDRTCKGTNNHYENSATEGNNISYTINVYNSGRWVCVGRTNCSLSSYEGASGATITVTVNETFPNSKFWGFKVFNYDTTQYTPPFEVPDETYDGYFNALGVNEVGFSTTGYTTVSGGLILGSVTNPTYGFRVFNSSGNITLDVTGIHPKIQAAGTSSTITAGSTQTINVTGLVPDGTWSIILMPPTSGYAAAALRWEYVASYDANGIFTGYQSGKFLIRNVSDSFNTPASYSCGYLVVSL